MPRIVLGDECPCVTCNPSKAVRYSPYLNEPVRSLAQAWEDRVQYAFNTKNTLAIRRLSNQGMRLIAADFPL